MSGDFKLGIIGGSGLEDPQFFKDVKEVVIDTPFGKPSDSYLEGTIEGVKVVLLARHGRKHDIMPGNVNFRANLWGMHMLGVKVIIASTACGSLQEHIKPGELVFPDSVFDRTAGRKSTFFDGEHNETPGVCHIQMHPAYSEYLRKVLAKTADGLGLKYHDGGFGVCIEGPRFSSKAESKVFRSWGASLVNMTLMPECVLAKELGIPYATTSLVTDYDCWREEEEQVSMEIVMATFKQNADKCKSLFLAAVPQIAKHDWTEEIKSLKMDPNRPQRFAFPVNNYLPSFTHLSHPLFREFMSEFVSTFLFIIVGIGCVITFKTTHSDFDTFLSLNLCWGFAVVFGGGLGIGVSGGHMNPAITLAQFVLGRKTWVQVLVYTPAQLLGTFAATACAYSDYTSIIDQFDGGHRTAKGNFSTLCFFVTCPNDWETNQLAGCWDQIIATGILGLVMASHIDPRNGVPRWMHPVLGGLSVMMIGMSFGMNDGYPINPARDLGARCFAAILYGKDAFTDRNYWFWVPIVGPTVGAVVGAWLYNLCVDLHSPKPEDDPTKNGFLRQNGIEEKWETVRGPNDEVRKDLSTDF